MAATKYILIERPGYNATAVSKETLNLMKEEGYEILSQAPVTMATIKKNRIRIYSYEECLRHITADKLYDKYHDKTFDAVVDWFNNVRGVGMITIKDELRLPIYACNIKGKKTWYPETACVYYTKGQKIQVKVTMPGRQTMFAEGLTQGAFDQEGWDRIKNQPLAFKCDDEGKAVTGLFA